MYQDDIDAKFQARLKGITAFIRALSLNRTLKLYLSHYGGAFTDGAHVHLPYSIFFGDFDRRYALGIAAHEVGHCLYTDFDSLDVYKENPTSLSDFFRLGSPGEFSLPLRGEDGAEEAYRLQSDFMRRETSRKCSELKVSYRNAFKLWLRLLNSLEDARIERRFKAERPETAYVINAVYTKALSEVEIKNLPYKVSRYVYGVCVMAAAVISHSVRPEAVDAFIAACSTDDEERDLLNRAQELIAKAVAYASCKQEGFMAAASETADLFDLTSALADLFIVATQKEQGSDQKQQQEKKRPLGKHHDIDSEEDIDLDLPDNPQEMLRDRLQDELSDAVKAYFKQHDISAREITVDSQEVVKTSGVSLRLPLDEITTAQNYEVMPICGDQSAVCRNLDKILYPPRSRNFAVAAKGCGVILDERRAAFAANRCVAARLFKAKSLTLSDGMTQLAVIIDTSSSTRDCHDDYLQCFELLRKVLGKADRTRLLSSIYCFGDSGVARIKRVNENFDARIAARLCYSGNTPGFAALYYAMSELAASPAKRRLLLCLTDGGFTDDEDICAGFMDKDGAGIDSAGIKLACVYVKTDEMVFPGGFKPHYSQIIAGAAQLPQAILSAVRAIY